MTTDLLWHQNLSNVIALARHLDSLCEIPDADAAIDLFESPWKWEAEWNEMQADETDPYVERDYTIGAGLQDVCDDVHDRIEQFIADDETPNASSYVTQSARNPRVHAVYARKSTHARMQAEFPEKIWSPYANA